jgi:hypothetical protein
MWFAFIICWKKKSNFTSLVTSIIYLRVCLNALEIIVSWLKFDSKIS